MRRWTWNALMLLAGAAAPALVWAQDSRFIVQGEAGRETWRQRLRDGRHDDLRDRFTDTYVGATIAYPLLPWLAPELSVRSSFLAPFPTHSVGLGVGVRPPGASRFHVHGAFSGMRAQSRGLYCPEGTAQCRDRYQNRWSIQLRTGYDLFREPHFSLGPTLWWSRSLEAPVSYGHLTYRGWGIGMQVGFH